MKRILFFKNKYFVFLFCYLSFLSVIGLSVVFSRYTSGDTGADNAAAAAYEIRIYSGESEDHQMPIDVKVHATSKMTEPASLMEGTYDISQINIVNLSDCDVRISDYSFDTAPDGKPYYSKLLMTDSISDIGTDVPEYLGISENTTIAQLNAAVDEKNQLGSKVIKRGQTESFYLVSWVEHENIYNTENFHNTISEIGVTPEHFILNVHSEQVD